MTSHSTVFLYGTLCDLTLLEIVAGEAVFASPATLGDHAVFWAKDQSFPIIVEADGETAEGILVEISAAAKARLDFYEVGFGYNLLPCTVVQGEAETAAEVYFAEARRWTPGALWSLTDWQSKFGILTREAARDYIGLYAKKTPQEAAQLFGQVRNRAASRLRARMSPSPSAFDPSPTREDVAIKSSHRPLMDFFDVVEETLQFQTFAGGRSNEVQRISLLGAMRLRCCPMIPQLIRCWSFDSFVTVHSAEATQTLGVSNLPQGALTLLRHRKMQRYASFAKRPELWRAICIASPVITLHLQQSVNT